MAFFFGRNKTRQALGPPEFIIVGLGNPGSKYENTRHNAGFLFLDMLSDDLNIKIDRLKFKSLTAIANINSHSCLIMKPQTFMNNSGEAVRDAAHFYKIPPQNVIVIYDDTALPLGKLRIRRKGTDGGHNGIKSIIYHLHSDEFPRLKLGIGKSPHEDFAQKDFVLSNFLKTEVDDMKAAMKNAITALPYILDGDIDGAMSRYSK